MIEIFLADQNDQLLEANLDGTTFYIHVAWNESGQQYTIGLQNSEGDTLVEGVAMVVGYPLFYRIRHSYMPLGDFMVVTNDEAELNRQSFVNNNGHLLYMTEQDLADYNLLEQYGRI